MSGIKQKWDHLYTQADAVFYPPSTILTENDFLLPKEGVALDLACGLGANSVFLAEKGLAVTAMDISSVAIKKLSQYALIQALNIDPLQVDLQAKVLEKDSFDVIVVSRFLDRSLSDAIIHALKPQGLLFYQTYTQLKTGSSGPNNPDFLLAENELVDLFSSLVLVYYRENGIQGDWQQGLRDEVQFIGRKVTG